MNIKRKIHYTYPVDKYLNRITGEQYIFEEVSPGRGLMYANRITIYLCNNTCIVKIGKNIVPIIFDWFKLCMNIDKSMAYNNGIYIEFTEAKKDDVCFLKDKSLHRIALRVYNMIKYFLICRSKIKENIEDGK